VSQWLELDKEPILERSDHIALDLRDVHDIDSSGLGAVIALREAVARAGQCSIELRGASSSNGSAPGYQHTFSV
jgi:anti-anti-sigma regulatory factor